MELIEGDSVQLCSGLAIVAVMALAVMPNLTHAAEPITDPRQYCDHAVELLADGKLDELAGDILAHSSKSALEVELRAAIAGFGALPLKVGPLRRHEHVSEWALGDAVVRHYYALIFDNTPFFLNCALYRPNESWLVSDFIGNADPAKIGLTQ